MWPRTLGLTLFYAIIALLMSGCKLALIVVEGGEVQYDSGRFSCQAGSICVIEIKDSNFQDVFIAAPADGYGFDRWLAGDGFLCGDSIDPRCTINIRPLAGNPGVEAVIASDTFFYLLPVFKKFESTPPDPAPSLTADLQAKFDGACIQCHVTGLGGAPRVGNSAEWAPRLDKGLDALVDSVKQGLSIMPPGGRCDNCSDGDYRALIEYMSTPN